MKIWVVIRKHAEGLEVLATEFSLNKAIEQHELYTKNLLSFAEKEIYLQEFESIVTEL